MRRNLLFLISLAALAGAGCNIVNPSETVPTYVRIDSFTVENNDLYRTGSVSHNIKSVWVYFDNQTVGIYDLPANVPIMATGPGTVQLVPAISYNGLSYVKQYPFYEADTFSIPYLPGEATYHTGKTRYRTNAKFQWKEDFEIGNSFIRTNSDATDDTVLLRTTDKDAVFEGAASGRIVLSATKPVSSVITSSGFSIASGEAYIEINHKSTVPFVVALQTTLASGDIVVRNVGGLNPSDTWRKTYIGLSDFTAQYKGTVFNVVIQTELPDGETEGRVLVDNLKVISF